MLIDLRELLSGSQDERIEKVSIESESFDTGIAKYSILEKPEFELSITRIGKNKLEKSYKADIEMNTFNTGSSDYDIIDKPAVDVIIKKLGKNKLSIKADSYVTLSIPCDRCLEPVDTRVDYTVDEIVDFNDNASEEEAKEEKDYIDGYDLDVDKLVFGEILISMPGKTLCKEDCKGICLICGANLNKGECGCDRDILDPRMSVFKDILKNFKEV